MILLYCANFYIKVSGGMRRVDSVRVYLRQGSDHMAEWNLTVSDKIW